MKTYGPEDLELHDDPIPMIRRRASWFVGDKGRGRYLLSCLLRDLIYLDVLPVRGDKISQWWVVYADRDWLSVGGPIDLKPFYQTIPFPVIGRNSMRTEVLVTALADAAVTIGANGITWLAGDRDSCVLPSTLGLEPPNGGSGRTLAFTINGDE